MTTCHSSQETLTTAIGVGALAPSLHNSQPWQFRVSDNTIDVYADRSRWLRVIDPSARELLISCGAAIRYIQAALRAEGMAETTTLLPDTSDSDHLARITVTGTAAPTADEKQLAEAIFVRYTDRGRFAEEPVPEALVDELQQGVAREGGWLRRIAAGDEEIFAAVALARADEIETADPAYQAELRDWSRSDDERAEDGIPRTAVSPLPVTSRASNYRLRDFDVDGDGAEPQRYEDPPVAEHPLVVILGTSTDDPRAWLVAGQALAWLLARSAANGVSAQPMTQVLEIPATRQWLRRGLNLVGHPQMLLRMGYGQGGPTTHRRQITDVIVE